MKLSKFLVGLLIGGLFGIIFWYWQKSTSAEDGAISVLDRLAASDARVRDLEARLRALAAEPVAPQETAKNTTSVSGPEDHGQIKVDNLQDIDGLGPTYARRLQEAGIDSFADLAQQTPLQVMEITAVRSVQTAESWILAAQAHLSA